MHTTDDFNTNSITHGSANDASTDFRTYFSSNLDACTHAAYWSLTGTYARSINWTHLET